MLRLICLVVMTYTWNAKLRFRQMSEILIARCLAFAALEAGYGTNGRNFRCAQTEAQTENLARMFSRPKLGSTSGLGTYVKMMRQRRGAEGVDEYP